MEANDHRLALNAVAAWVPGATLAPLGAMNSSTWLVEGANGRHVLKITDPTRGQSQRSGVGPVLMITVGPLDMIIPIIRLHV